jgi:thiosulfate/3-mercaptopyruvate sulfurtransferase
VTPLAPHEKIFVDSEFAEDENHGAMGCEECHGGDPNEPDWEKAHIGLVKDPSFPDPSFTCGLCHEDIAEHYQTSLHASLSPFKQIIDTRASDDKAVYTKLNDAREGHCTSCHSSCGQCHVSRPEAVEGGLLESHLFQGRPPMQTVCTACHGSRIEKEYLGKNKGIPPDVHKTKYFKCNKCHTADEMHGDGNEYANRYMVQNAPRCVECHEEIFADGAENADQHRQHKGRLSCQVCHSMPYKNCYSCHLGRDKMGYKFFKTQASTMEFKIGRNPYRSEKRPEQYVTVRHVPVDQKSFDFYVENGLANFDRLPTWKLATPHNIQRKTPQNRSCNACHGKAALFLLETDVKPEYLQANRTVIVSPDQVPQSVTE